jgi:diacylglycerol kinase family enzyme
MMPSPSLHRPLDPAFVAEVSRPDLRLVPREHRVAVLLNANAKRVGPKVREAVEALMPADDVFYSRTLEEGRVHARAILERRYSTVLVGGGDGTITSAMNMLIQAANGMARVGHRYPLPDLGILRLGTGNGLANVCGSGDPLEDVARAVSGERPAARPLRLVEDAASGWAFPFASMGYDAQVLNDYVDLVASCRTRTGKLLAKSLAGYFYAVGTRTIPAEMRARRAHVRVVAKGRASVIDPSTGEEVPLTAGATLFEGMARAVLVGTSPFYGYALKALPFAMRRTDRFQVRVSSASIGFVLAHLPSLWKGTLRTPEIVDFLVEGVSVESSEELPLQFAGDARGHTRSLDLRLSDRVVRLVDGTGRRAE